MTCSPTGMPACLRASSRQSNAARSCAKHDHERNVMGCSQTLKNDTLTHPSLWADHSLFNEANECGIDVTRPEAFHKLRRKLFPYRSIIPSRTSFLHQRSAPAQGSRI